MEATTTSTDKKLQNKVAIITGGASGIGEATALLFAEHGCRAIVIADVQDEMGQNLAETIGLDRSTYIRCDVTKEDQVESLVQTTCRLYGRLDVMFCNAGILSRSTLDVLNLDLEAGRVRPADGGQRAWGGSMREARGSCDGRGGWMRGSIVCTASTAAGKGGARSTDYTMSKYAVVGLVQSASVQLGTPGVRVNCVSPGWVATPLLLGFYEGLEVAEVERGAAERQWLPGEMKVRNVADAVLFLTSQDSAFITGHNLVVDGGFRG